MSKFKVVPTPDHGTRLVPVDPTPKTEEEWLQAACEHDITYGQDSTPPGSHTPGPWRDSFHDYAFIETIGGIAIAKTDCSINRGRGQWVECLATSRANARLIAAAPELLEALENMLAHEGEIEVSGIGVESDSEALVAARRKAKAAIAKATGGAL